MLYNHAFCCQLEQYNGAGPGVPGLILLMNLHILAQYYVGALKTLQTVVACHKMYLP